MARQPHRRTTSDQAPDREGPGPAPAPAQPDTARGGTGPPGGLARLRARLARARCLWRDFTRESAYDRYVERHRREHPDHEPMSEREWWRARAEHDERNVSTGCC